MPESVLLFIFVFLAGSISAAFFKRALRWLRIRRLKRDPYTVVFPDRSEWALDVPYGIGWNKEKREDEVITAREYFLGWANIELESTEEDRRRSDSISLRWLGELKTFLENAKEHR